jgi:hypothetical protein
MLAFPVLMTKGVICWLASDLRWRMRKFSYSDQHLSPEVQSAGHAWSREGHEALLTVDVSVGVPVAFYAFTIYL